MKLLIALTPQMLFLWSREPAPGPRAGPWFAWFATALLLWRCRRKITKSILAVSPLRFLKRRAAIATINSKAPLTATFMKKQQRQMQQQQRLKQENTILVRKPRRTGIRTKVKRLCIGDGPHVTHSASVIQSNQQIHYRVTRSGKIYGKYPNKVASSTNSSKGSQ